MARSLRPEAATLPHGAPLSREAVEAVAARIRSRIRRTPVIDLDLADFGLPPGPLTLKLEQLQHSGSFKVRGAFANLLLRDIPAAGVVAASGGNHGAAVAYAAGKLGVRARIFVPEIAYAAGVLGLPARIFVQRLRVVAEPGGCAALAAVLSGRYCPAPDEHVAVIVSGANTTAVDFSR
jgi:threonine dehydratase